MLAEERKQRKRDKGQRYIEGKKKKEGRENFHRRIFCCCHCGKNESQRWRFPNMMEIFGAISSVQEDKE
jgi:hypothetical protein